MIIFNIKLFDSLNITKKGKVGDIKEKYYSYKILGIYVNIKEEELYKRILKVRNNNSIIEMHIKPIKVFYIDNKNKLGLDRDCSNKRYRNYIIGETLLRDLLREEIQIDKRLSDILQDEKINMGTLINRSVYILKDYSLYELRKDWKKKNVIITGGLSKESSRLNKEHYRLYNIIEDLGILESEIDWNNENLNLIKKKKSEI